MNHRRSGTARTVVIIGILMLLRAPAPTQQPNSAAVIRSVDAAVASRSENVLGFTDVEHLAVYRGSDETQPAAEMTVLDTYKRGVGKEFTVISQSGSAILLRFGLNPFLDSDHTINQPGNVEKSWFISANYLMTLKAGGVQKLDGRDCFALDIKPKAQAPNLIIGTIWVDTHDGTLIKVDGVASKNPSPWSGTTHMMRQYSNINGYSMAMHARAESESAFFGRTVVTIDYSDYKLVTKTGR